MAVLAPAHRRMFLAWGVVVALLVVLSIPFSPEPRPARLSAFDWMLWAAAYVAFLVLFWIASRSNRRVLLIAQTIAVLLIISTRPALGLEGALFVLVAFQLGTEERPRVALLWISAQSLALLAILEFRFGMEHAVGILAAYFPFQLLAFYTSRVFAELLATREKLAANSRAAERLRISRELHDVFGHRLAAVNVNLEVASRVADAEKHRFVERAHASAKALLNDVREVVANLRRDSPVDLRELMQSVISDVPRPAIHLDCDANACVDAESAQLLIRCAQEIVTNSMKHSTGENLWMRLRIRDGAVEFTAEDDGCGTAEVHERGGLRGMRERVEGAGGSLHIAGNNGFRIELVVPGAGA